MSWRWVSIAAMLAALVLAYGVFTGGNESSVRTRQPPPRPGYLLKDAVITETQPDGSPGVRVIATRIEQLPNDGFSMSKVRVDYLRIPDKEWKLSAERGFIPADFRVVELSGDVQLRPADAGSNMSVRTEALAIDMTKNLAYSKGAKVQLQFGNYRLTVDELRADLSTERVETKHGRGTVLPDKAGL
jgi:LPS export ABC transporter protein LptC